MPGSPTGAFGLWSLHAPSFTHMDWQKSFTESLVGSTWSGQEEGHVASRAKEALSFISWPQGRWRTEPSLGVLLEFCLGSKCYRNCPDPRISRTLFSTVRCSRTPPRALASQLSQLVSITP